MTVYCLLEQCTGPDDFNIAGFPLGSDNTLSVLSPHVKSDVPVVCWRQQQQQQYLTAETVMSYESVGAKADAWWNMDLLDSSQQI